ncbi:MAG: hypothetical protein AAGD05_11910, partial [Bacteroidota bacterium]
SANVNDLIRLGLPAVFPQHYALPKTIRAMAASYRDEAHCVQILLEWIRNRTFDQIKEKCAKYLAAYQPQQVKQHFHQFLVDLQLYEQ